MHPDSTFKKRILLVEPIKELRTLLKEGLEYLGYSVISATEGIEGIKKYDSGIDAVITTPQYMFDGSEFTATLKNIYKDAKIILINDFYDPDLFEKTLPSALGYLNRPFRLTNIPKKKSSDEIPQFFSLENAINGN